MRGLMGQRDICAFLATALALVTSCASATAQPRALQIGMAKTFVHDQPQVFIDLAAGEFKEVMKESTGLDGELLLKHGPLDVGDKLNGKQLDFAILHAHEFAWARKKHPDLQPLLIAATKQKEKRVHIVV